MKPLNAENVLVRPANVFNVEVDVVESFAFGGTCLGNDSVLGPVPARELNC